MAADGRAKAASADRGIRPLGCRPTSLHAQSRAPKRYADVEVRSSAAGELAGYGVVALTLPHSGYAAIAAKRPAGTMVVECRVDQRLNEPAAWARCYGGEHTGHRPPGLPELPSHR